MSAYEIIWEFTVTTGQRPAFEAAYGSTGPWAELFSKAAGYIETKVLRDLERDGIYLTIDRWASEVAFMDFKRDCEVAYDRLDRQCKGLSERERRVGAFTMVSTLAQL